MGRFALSRSGNILVHNGYGIGRDIINSSGLQSYTIRVQYPEGFDPSTADSYHMYSEAMRDEFTRRGTWTQVSTSPNIWDRRIASASWKWLFAYDYALMAVIDANSTGVTDMSYLFYNSGIRYEMQRIAPILSMCNFDTSSVTKAYGMFQSTSISGYLPKFDLRNVTDFGMFCWGSTDILGVSINISAATSMFAAFGECRGLLNLELTGYPRNLTNIALLCNGCVKLKHVPNFNTVQSVTNAYSAFQQCYLVESGAYSLYSKLKVLNPVPTHTNTFLSCGRDTVTGAAELEQIPSGWK